MLEIDAGVCNTGLAVVTRVGTGIAVAVAARVGVDTSVAAAFSCIV